MFTVKDLQMRGFNDLTSIMTAVFKVFNTARLEPRITIETMDIYTVYLFIIVYNSLHCHKVSPRSSCVTCHSTIPLLKNHGL
jgi:hypothetical protein